MIISKFLHFIAFFILVLFLHPFYMEQSVYSWLFRSRWKNEIVRININNLDEHTVEILKNKDVITIRHLTDCEEDNIESCTIIELPVSNKWNDYNISFKVIGNGKNQIRFRGPQVWEDDSFVPILVDYANISVNEHNLNVSQRTIWYDYSIDTPVYEVKDGDVFTFSVAVRRHHLKIDDLKLIYKTYSKWKITSVWRLVGTILFIIVFLVLIYFRKYKHLFCFVVFVFLSLPFIYISKDDISKQENRSLSKFPSLFTDGKINEKFGRNFDSWFSDRFGGRKMFIDLRFFILYRINNKIANDKAFMGDDGWLFPTKGITKVSSEEEQRKVNTEVADILKKIDDYMKGKDVSIYAVLEPSRSLLYKKYWENYYPYLEHINYSEELKEKLKERKNIHIIDLKNIFEKNKDNFQLYEKNDSHMTLPAINLMIEEIVSAMGEDVKNYYKKSIIYKDHDCRLFDYSKIYDDFLEINSEEKKETCKLITMVSKNLKSTETEVGWQAGEVSSPYINRDLYIVSLCYGEFLYPVLGEMFLHTISVNYNAIEDHDEEALKNKAILQLKAVKPGTVIILFFSYPTEFYMSRSVEFWEAF